MGVRGSGILSSSPRFDPTTTMNNKEGSKTVRHYRSASQSRGLCLNTTTSSKFQLPTLVPAHQPYNKIPPCFGHHKACAYTLPEVHGTKSKKH